MKLRKLIMQAFGPYTERIELDFEKGLAGSTFFLIHGMTGAGKTTILDAISFALYGRASGSLRTGTMLRAGNARPETETEVELMFSLGTRTYHVLRRPKYQREDRKSATPARAELYDVDVQADGGETLIVSGFSDVTERIEVLTGFHCEEFRQVMLLPQGEFRTFLMADSKKRGDLMRVLFHTEQYARIEQKLKERAGSIVAQNEKNLEEQKRIFAQAGYSPTQILTVSVDDMVEIPGITVPNIRTVLCIQKKLMGENSPIRRAMMIDDYLRFAERMGVYHG